mgnify:CR=1 FL=1
MKLAERYGLKGPRTVAALATLESAVVDAPSSFVSKASRSEALGVHLADSLSALELDVVKHARSAIDIGTGAGLPGLALAIAVPQCQWTLVDATARKAAYVASTITQLGITNARAVAARAEELPSKGSPPVQLVTCRAVAPLAVLLEYAAPLLEVGGHAVMWKGQPAPVEVSDGAIAAEILGMSFAEAVPVAPYKASTSRNLYLYSKLRETPSRFPRRAGVAAKRPLK